MKKRELWVDYAKAIGIILVVYGHVARGLHKAGLPMSEYWFSLVDSIIYSFHMPLFFFLSGLFFYDALIKRKTSGLIVSKLETVIYPYIVWSLLQGLSEVVLSRYTNGNVSLTEVFSLLWQPRAQFWFLYALFFVFVFCSFVYSSVSKKYFLPLVLIFAGLYVFKEQCKFITITNFIVANTVFFALGIWFNEIKKYFEDRFRLLTLVFGMLFILGQYLLHFIFGLNYQVGGLPILFLATISIFFITSASMWLGQVRIDWFLYIGASSMTIFVMHVLAGSGARVILHKFMGIESLTIHLLLGTLAGLLLPLLAQKLINKKYMSYLLTWPRLGVFTGAK
jgi:fucose 4-O-acetylase-like acetyltransferase